MLIEHPMSQRTEGGDEDFTRRRLDDTRIQERMVHLLLCSGLRTHSEGGRFVDQHADVLPGIPVHRDDWRRAVGTAVVREYIEEGIGGAIIYLAETTEDGA